jgi:hypothetical protein
MILKLNTSLRQSWTFDGNISKGPSMERTVENKERSRVNKTFNSKLSHGGLPSEAMLVRVVLVTGEGNLTLMDNIPTSFVTRLILSD